MLKCVLLLLTLGAVAWGKPSQEEVGTSHNWDVLIFTHHWPNTACIPWEEKRHTCLLFQQWSVHGIWPTKLGTISPGYCNNTWHFQISELESIQLDLDKNWPNLFNGTAEDSLWKHEWQKHGTCAAQLETLNTELKYFSKGLAWHAQYNMTQALQSSGIYPSSTQTYNVKEIWDAVQQYTQKNPGIECFNDFKTGNTYLMEIRICFDKELNLMDCDGIVSLEGDIITNCPSDAAIKYPNTVPIDPWQSLEKEYQVILVE